MDSLSPVVILDSIVTMDVDHHQSTPVSTPSSTVAFGASELPPPTTTNVAQQTVDPTAANVAPSEAQENEQADKPKRASTRAPSKVWSHFNKIPDASSSSDGDSNPEDGGRKSNATRAGKKAKKYVHAPFSADWSNTRSFVKFLKVLFDATIKFSASTSITSNSFMWQLCVIHQQLAIWRNSEDPFIFNMAAVMTENYMKYWGSYEAMNPFLFIVVLLDPREKEVGLNFRLEILCKDDLERVAELRDCVKKDLERLFNEYKLLYSVGNEATSTAQDTEMVESGVDSLDNMEALLKGRLEKHRMESVSIEGRPEVERYLDDVCENATPQFDVLGW
ncbi:hypothetical protein MKX03_031094 [Papaver bracteatum]|nr:hypothetical protein MKX03_031094 [Papaver bracteatum]